MSNTAIIQFPCREFHCVVNFPNDWYVVMSRKGSNKEQMERMLKAEYPGATDIVVSDFN